MLLIRPILHEYICGVLKCSCSLCQWYQFPRLPYLLYYVHLIAVATTGRYEGTSSSFSCIGGQEHGQQQQTKTNINAIKCWFLKFYVAAPNAFTEVAIRIANFTIIVTFNCYFHSPDHPQLLYTTVGTYSLLLQLLLLRVSVVRLFIAISPRSDHWGCIGGILHSTICR